ncbi:MAG TPA: FecR domain-containing protein, partial [Sphingobacteriaceae bacterium]
DSFSSEPDIEDNLSTDEKDLLKEEIKASLLQRIEYGSSVRPLYTRNYFRISVAAAILVIISAGTYFFSVKLPQKQIAVSAPNKNDLVPGGNKAILILADGSKIILDNAKNGIVAKQAGLVITKTREGQLVYDISSTSPSVNSNTYNTIQTPKGGQYQVNLPDGSQVWLNSESSLKFPTAFTGSERRVVLTGEAYFEIKENKNKPFRVAGNTQTVEVLGTHFNVNSYADESVIKTTLLEGSVKVTTDNSNTIIKPGEQSQVKTGVSQIAIVQADTEGSIAWKNGFFYFKDADIKTVMRQLSRWYDVDVEYEGTIPHRVFSGKIYRNVNASQVLDILRFTKIHFRIEGKRIIVTP